VGAVGWAPPICADARLGRRSAGDAVAAYRELVEDPGQAEAMGRLARERVLDEHTYAHRARRLLELVGLEAGVTA